MTSEAQQHLGPKSSFDVNKWLKDPARNLIDGTPESKNYLDVGIFTKQLAGLINERGPISLGRIGSTQLSATVRPLGWGDSMPAALTGTQWSDEIGSSKGYAPLFCDLPRNVFQVEGDDPFGTPNMYLLSGFVLGVEDLSKDTHPTQSRSVPASYRNNLLSDWRISAGERELDPMVAELPSFLGMGMAIGTRHHPSGVEFGKWKAMTARVSSGKARDADRVDEAKVNPESGNTNTEMDGEIHAAMRVAALNFQIEIGKRLLNMPELASRIEILEIQFDDRLANPIDVKDFAQFNANKLRYRPGGLFELKPIRSCGDNPRYIRFMPT